MAQTNKNGKSARTTKTRKKPRSRARPKAKTSTGKKTAGPVKAVESPEVAIVVAKETTVKALETPKGTPTQAPPLPEDGSAVIAELMKVPTFRQMVIARLINKLG
jgi:hypothetical protein